MAVPQRLSPRTGGNNNSRSGKQKPRRPNEPPSPASVPRDLGFARPLRDHYLYLLEQKPRIAERFASAIEKSFDRRLETPDLGFVGQFAEARLQDVRSWQVRGLRNHLIYYRITTDGIEVLRILHGSRDADQLLKG